MKSDNNSLTKPLINKDWFVKNPKYSTIDETFTPYIRQHGPKHLRLYEYTKTIICFFTLFPIRVLMLVLSTICAYTASKLIVTYCPKSYHKKLGHLFIYPFIHISHYAFGFLGIKQTKLTWNDLSYIYIPPEQSPTPVTNPYPQIPPQVIVSNHLSYLDMIILITKYKCCFVAKKDVQHVPIYGMIANAINTIYMKEHEGITQTVVHRVNSAYNYTDDDTDELTDELTDDTNDTDNKSCLESCDSLPQLCVFPEGTTTNGTCMTKFRTGIFLAGKPIQPVVIKYPSRHFSLSWESIHFHEHVFRCMTQFINFVEIVELPVYCPSKEEIANPQLYAQNVQQLYAHVLQQSIYPLNRKHKSLYHGVVLGKYTPDEALRQASVLTENDRTLQYSCCRGSSTGSSSSSSPSSSTADLHHNHGVPYVTTKKK